MKVCERWNKNTRGAMFIQEAKVSKGVNLVGLLEIAGRIAISKELIHLANPQSRPVVITIFARSVWTFVRPTFQNFAKQNNFQGRIVTGTTVGLAEWIIDDPLFCLTLFSSSTWWGLSRLIRMLPTHSNLPSKNSISSSKVVVSLSKGAMNNVFSSRDILRASFMTGRGIAGLLRILLCIKSTSMRPVDDLVKASITCCGFLVRLAKRLKVIIVSMVIQPGIKNVFKRQVSSMIPSARPTIPPVAITILTCFAWFWKVKTVWK